MTDIVSEETYSDSAYLRDSAGFFQTLSSIAFYELSQEQLDALRQVDWLAMAQESEDILAEGYRQLGRYLSRAGLNIRQDLAVEYARIFLGAGIADGKIASPFESVFTSPGGLMMQDSRDDVVRIYAKNGMRADPELQVPEDHLSFELGFVAFMAGKTADALDAGEDVAALLTTQITFIDQHLLNWLDDLAARVEQYANSAFYPAVMKVMIGTLKQHREYLAEM